MFSTLYTNSYAFDIFMLSHFVDWWKHGAHQSRLGLARTHGVFFSASIALDRNNNTELNTVLPSVVHPINTFERVWFYSRRSRDLCTLRTEPSLVHADSDSVKGASY